MRGGDKPGYAARNQAFDIACGLPKYVRCTGSKFLADQGVAYDTTVLRMFHDGADKSVYTFDRVVSTLITNRVAVTNCMEGKPADVSEVDWIAQTAFNTSNHKRLVAVVLIVSTATIQSLLMKAAGGNHPCPSLYIAPCAGSITVVDYPSDGSPSTLHAFADCKLSKATPGMWGNAELPDNK